MTRSAGGLGVGGDVEQALGNVGVPSYVLDTTGIIRWINPAAERLLGDVRGRLFTSVVAPEDSRRARELFSQKVLGTAPATEATAVLVSNVGTRVAVEISSVRSGAVNAWSASSGCSREAPRRHPHRRTRISPPVKSRCCDCWSRGARTSRLPQSFT
jgi:PAS domain S-box-containing protein